MTCLWSNFNPIRSRSACATS